MIWYALFAIYQLVLQAFTLVINAFYALVTFLAIALEAIPFTLYLVELLPGVVGVGIVTSIAIAIVKLLAKVGS